MSDGFKGSVYWNSYQNISAKVIQKRKNIYGKNIYELLSASFQGVERLFGLAYVIDAGAANNEAGIKDNGKYFLPRGIIEYYNALTDERNFYDQPIDYLIKQYDEVRKYQQDMVMIMLQEGCLLDYTYFKDNYRLILQTKALDVDTRAIQQIVFQGVAGGADNTKIRLYRILEKWKETILQKNSKSSVNNVNGWIQ